MLNLKRCLQINLEILMGIELTLRPLKNDLNSKNRKTQSVINISQSLMDVLETIWEMKNIL